jgi:hypothetical protein
LGVNLSVALGPNATFTDSEKKQWLAPWNWEIHQWHIAPAIDGSQVQQSPAANPPAPLTPSQNEFFGALTTELNARLSQSILDDAVTWQAAIQPTTEKVSNTKSANAKSFATWQAQLLDQSMLPSPLSSWLNLSAVLKVDLPQTVSGYIVAPEFSIGTTKLVPTNVTNDNGLWKWEYSVSGNGFSAAAFMPPSAKVKGKETFINLDDLLVYSSETSDEDRNDDWRTHITDRIAVGFDMAQILIYATEQCSSVFDYSILAKMFLASLRDQIRPTERLGNETLDAFTSSGGTLLLQFAESGALDEYQTWVEVIQNGAQSASTPLPSRFLSPFQELAKIGSNAELSSVLGNMRSLHGSILDQGVLAALVIFQWEFEHPEFLKTSGYDQFRKFCVDTYFPKVDLRQKLLSGLASPFIGQLFNPISAPRGTTEANQLRSNFVNTLISQPISQDKGSYWNLRFSTNQITPKIDGQEVRALATLLTPKAKDWADQFASTVLIPKTSAGAKAPSSAGSSPILIPLDRIRLASADGTDDHDDVQRHIRGTLTFVRRSSQGGTPWRCLNTAQAIITILDQNGKPKSVCLDSPVVVASRGGYSANLSQSVAAYDDGPLAAKGPQAYASDAHFGISSTISAMRNPIVGYTYWKPPAGDPKNHPSPMSGNFCSLAFSHTFDAFSCGVSNAGILPEILTQSTDPTRLNDEIPASVTLPSTVRHSFPYKRRVPVGPIQLVAHRDAEVDKPERHVEFPVIPDSILPLSRDKKAISPSTKTQEDSSRETVPLLMLVPDSFHNRTIPNFFEFDVVPPYTDLQTWSRWVRDDKTFDSQRREAWSQRFSGKPTQLLDPAVQQVLINIDGVALGAFPVDHHAPNKNRIHVTCNLDESSNTPSSAIDVTNRRATIFIKKGSFRRIEFSLLVADSDVAQKFDNIDGFVPSSQSNFHAASNLAIQAEAATEEMPSREDIAAALSTSFTSPETVQVTMYNANSSKTQLFSYVGYVQFHRQVWRWRGRPVKKFDPQWLNGSAQFGDELAQWEAEQFGDRDDGDHCVVSASQIGKQTFSYSESVSSDPRATYFRFAATAHSRYEGLFQPDSKPIPSTLQNLSTASRWKRLFVPCRWAEKIPPPKVTVVLPLTEAVVSASDSDKNRNRPGLLVVLSEPWYGIGGLAEELQIDVALSEKTHADVATPNKTQSQTDVQLYEYGHDPARETSSCQPLAARFWEPALALDGPVGHTFDLSFENPLFVSSSFVIRPPDLQCGKPWDFIKLRFRRNLFEDLRATYLSQLNSTLKTMQSRLGEGTSEAATSEYTEAHWVQFLPAFSLKSDDPNLARVMVDRSGDTIQLSLSGDPKLSLSTLFSVEPKRTIAALTLTVFDIVGNPNQERFIGLFRPNLDLTEWKYLPKTAGGGISLDAIPKERFKVRLLEFECNDENLLQTITTEEGFWAHMFDDRDPDKSDTPGIADKQRSRIIRITRAFGDFGPACRPTDRPAAAAVSSILSKEGTYV